MSKPEKVSESGQEGSRNQNILLDYFAVELAPVKELTDCDVEPPMNCSVPILRLSDRRGMIFTIWSR